MTYYILENKKTPLLRFSTAFFITIFLLNFHIVPGLFALTVEEEALAKKRAEKRIRYKERKTYSEKPIYKTVERRNIYRPVPPKKDPRLACILSLVLPGSGHIYLRKDLKGVGFCLAAFSGYTATAVYSYMAFFGSSSTTLKTRIIITSLLFLISAVFHIVGVVEAYADAEDINRDDNYGLKHIDSPFVAKIEYQ